MTGEPSFFSLGVQDAERGRAFYGALFGWRMEPGPNRGFAITTTGVPGGIHDDDLAGISVPVLPGGRSRRGARTVREPGGAVEETEHDDEDDPESVARFGRFALCRDDQGSSFGLHQPPA